MLLTTGNQYFREAGGPLKSRERDKEVTLYRTQNHGVQEAEGANLSACDQTVLSSGAREIDMPGAEQPRRMALK